MVPKILETLTSTQPIVSALKLTSIVKKILKGAGSQDDKVNELYIKSQIKGHLFSQEFGGDIQRTRTDILKDNKELLNMLGQKIEEINKLVRLKFRLC